MMFLLLWCFVLQLYFYMQTTQLIWSVLFSSDLFCTDLYCSDLFCTDLYCTVLIYSVLICTPEGNETTNESCISSPLSSLRRREKKQTSRFHFHVQHNTTQRHQSNKTLHDTFDNALSLSFQWDLHFSYTDFISVPIMVILQQLLFLTHCSF